MDSHKNELSEERKIERGASLHSDTDILENEEEMSNVTYDNKEKIMTIEWENFANEEFEILSINNGIMQNRLLYYPNEDSHLEKIIELQIKNGNEFSFKQDDEREDTVENTIRPEKESKDEVSSSDLTAKERDALIMEKNENNLLFDEFMNDEEDFDEEKNWNNDMSLSEKENYEVREKEKDNFTLDEFKTTKIYDEDIKVSPQFFKQIKHELHANEENQTEIKKVEEFNFIKTIPISNINIHSETNAERTSYLILPEPSTQEVINTKMLEKKESQINTLNDKLNKQKFQNKLILEENNKLLEVISIFRILQNLENGSNNNTISQSISKNDDVNTNNQIEFEDVCPIKEINQEAYISLENKTIKFNTLDFKNYNRVHEINDYSNSIKSQLSNKSHKEQIDQRDEIYFNNNLKDRDREHRINYDTLANDREMDNINESRNKNFIKTNKSLTSSYGVIYKNKTITKTGKKENSQIGIKSFIKINTPNNNNTAALEERRLNYNSINTDQDKDEGTVTSSTSKCLLRAKKKSETENYNSNKNKLTTIPITMRLTAENDISSQIYNKNKIDRRSILTSNKKSSDVVDVLKSLDDTKVNLKIINNFANTHNFNNYQEKDNTSYDHLIHLLESYKEMNDKLMSCLNNEDISVKIDTERRRKDVGNLESILDYITSMQLEQEKQEHVIPFYLIDKRRLYENIVNFIYHDKEKVNFKPLEKIERADWIERRHSKSFKF